MEQFAAAIFGGLSHSGGIWDHFAGWWARRADPNVLWVCFEDLKEDLPREVGRPIGRSIGRSVGRSVGPSVRPSVAAREMASDVGVGRSVRRSLRARWRAGGGSSVALRCGREMACGLRSRHLLERARQSAVRSADDSLRRTRATPQHRHTPSSRAPLSPGQAHRRMAAAHGRRRRARWRRQRRRGLDARGGRVRARGVHVHVGARGAVRRPLRLRAREGRDGLPAARALPRRLKGASCRARAASFARWSRRVSTVNTRANARASTQQQRGAFHARARHGPRDDMEQQPGVRTPRPSDDLFGEYENAPARDDELSPASCLL